jgi:hypothetical protein
LTFPKFYRWGGGGIKYTWSFGWLAGIDGDLVCIKEDVQTEAVEELVLSPVCTSRIIALCGFLCKVFLLKFDHNLLV